MYREFKPYTFFKGTSVYSLFYILLVTYSYEWARWRYLHNWNVDELNRTSYVRLVLAFSYLTNVNNVINIVDIVIDIHIIVIVIVELEDEVIDIVIVIYIIGIAIDVRLSPIDWLTVRMCFDCSCINYNFFNDDVDVT